MNGENAVAIILIAGAIAGIAIALIKSSRDDNSYSTAPRSKNPPIYYEASDVAQKPATIVYNNTEKISFPKGL